MSVLRGDQARALFARMRPNPHRFTTQLPAPPTDPTAGLTAGRIGLRAGKRPDPFGVRAALEQGRPETALGGLDDGRCPQVPVVAVVTTGGDRPVLAEAGSAFTVVTEHHTQAVVVVSAALRSLASRGVGVADSSLLVVGTEQNPVVAVLATALGVGTVVSWNPSDAEDFPLPMMCRRADVIVDLLGLIAADSSGRVDAFRPAPVVRPDPVATVRALPHLLHHMATDAGADLLAAATSATATLPSPTPTAPTHDFSGAHAPLSPHPDTTPDVPGAQTPTSADQEETR